jgi:hypothetical protein
MINNLEIKGPDNPNLENKLKETIDEIYIYENSDEEKELLNLLKNNSALKVWSMKTSFSLIKFQLLFLLGTMLGT